MDSEITNVPEKGPVLTDADFFNRCLTKELSFVQDASVSGDDQKAVHLFAEYVRAHYDRKIYLRATGEDYDSEQFLQMINREYGGTENLLKKAELAEQHYLVSCGTPMQFGERVDWFSNPTYNQYCEWPWQLSRHAEFFALANAYRLSGNERWARAFAELWRSWVEQAVRPDEPTSSYATLCWRTIEAGIRMFSSWPYAFSAFVCSPSLSDRDIVDWCKSIWEHGYRLRAHPTQNNWLIMEMEGLLHIGVLYPFLADAAVWRDYSISRLTEELEGQIYPDGFQVELTTCYHTGVLCDFLTAFGLYQEAGYPFPEHCFTVLKSMAGTMIRLMRPDGRLPDINDGEMFSVHEVLSAEKRFFEKDSDICWCISGGKEGAKPAYTSTVFEYSGIAIMRTGWGKDDIWALFDGGPFGAAHQHEDKLNFLMSCGEHNVLTEANRYAYDTSPMRAYCLATSGHNTVLVNGLGQNRRETFHWDKSMIPLHSGIVFRSTTDYDYTSAEYSEPYGSGDQAVCDVRHARSVLFLKQPGYSLKPFFLITDRLFCERENDYTTLWHIDTPELEIGKNRVSCEGLALLYTLDETDGAWTETVRGKRGEDGTVQGWSTLEAIQGKEFPVFCVTCHIHAGNIRRVTLISPDRNAPIVSVTADKDVNSSDILIKLYNGTEIKLNENDYN